MELIIDISNVYGKDRAQLCRNVLTVLSAKIRAKNLFGWRSFLDEVLENVVNYMISTNFVYSGGAYVAWGMQSALDSARYCSAKKRRSDYEAISLEELFQVEDQTESRSQEKEVLELSLDITLKFGKELAKELEPFLKGYEAKLSKKVLEKIKTPEFVEWFKEYTSKKDL